MARKSLSLFAVSAISAVLLAACSAAPANEAESTSDQIARAVPGQELMVLPPMVARGGLEIEAKDGEHRFAETTAVSVTPSTTGVWDEPSPGIRRWRFSVERAGAVSQNLGFTRYKMPRGGKLRLLDENAHEIAVFTDQNNKAHGELWTPIVPGIRATVEVLVPKTVEPYLDLSLTQVNSAFKGFEPGVERSGSCNVDVVCSEGDGWRNEIKSTAVISLGGSRMCTGTLLNDTSGSGRPFFLTAAHCRVNAANAASLVVYWNYETSSCGGRPDGQLHQFNTGSVFRAARTASDFTLVELDDAPDPAFEVFWSGWDARAITPNSAVAIHHPSVHEKRISFENDPLSVTTYLQNAVPGDGTHLRVTDWDLGTTEPGSSGSGIWNDEHRLVGQLHGGYASCSSQTSDWYGWFHTSYTAGATPAERAKDWLDAANTGAEFVDGKGGCARPTIDFTTTPNPSQLGQSVTASSTVAGGTGPYTYSWDMNGDGTADCTTEDCAFTYDQEFDGNIALTVKDSTGCAAVVRHQQVVSDPSICPTSVDATDVPKDIPDNNPAGVLSTLNIPTAGTVSGAKLSVRIQHTYSGDVRISLISPNGTEVEVKRNQGGSADNISITDKELPSLNGQPLSGDWKLKVVDSASSDVGKLVSWKLSFRTACSTR